MPRLLRKAVIAAKIHATYTVDPLPTGAENAMLVSNVSIEALNAETKDRDVIRAYLGAAEQLMGSRYKSIGFDVELAGAGTVAVAPAWGALLRACGFAETITATVRVDYTPISNAFEAVAIYYWDDGVLHKLLGARGTAQVKLGVGEIPRMSFKFVGLDGGDAAQVNPSATLTAFKVPQVVTDQNTGALTWGATHATGVAPALTGGTTQASQGLELDLGVAATFTPLIGGETVPITKREVTGFVALDLSAADTITFLDKARTAGLQSLGMRHGTVANEKTLVYCPSVQVTKPEKREINGMRLEGFGIRALPTAAGNDELRIVTSFA